METSAAKRFYFDGEIKGNQIVVTVPLSRAADLVQYANTDREGAKLRYVDVNGRIIEGVKRDVNITARTLTLTYPEGETPDNPFIMEVVRDDTAAEFIAVITATNAAVETPESVDTENPYSDVTAEGQVAEPDKGSYLFPILATGAGILLIIALVIAGLRRRSHRRG
ncbi:hypothetical protein JKI95_00985 [Corynebacterium aquatimens]|uniref:hypothetical protein n=1 Tax=Corynebacterium aquatimens TaxID=1190508 RepID=UPI002540E63B|nr:hypothetical protein [Corynebacterium aquatimens]QYH19774.1 hypothetical protein JKI95_00985 [Corynebacterium aquatimens]